MFMYGGSYVKGHEVKLEDAFPIQFPFGTGGMHLSRRVPVSSECCLQHYMRLSLNQFMRTDFVHVCYQLLCRSKSYTTGLIKFRSDFNGMQFAERLSRMSVDEVKQACEAMASNTESNSHQNESGDAIHFLNSVTTSCKVLGHTTEAAKEPEEKYML